MPKARKRTSRSRKSKPVSAGFKRCFYVMIAAIVAGVLLGNRGFRSFLSNSFRLRNVNQEIGALREEAESIEKRIEAVRTDDRALERVARKDLGFQRPGEIEYRFPPPAPE